MKNWLAYTSSFLLPSVKIGEISDFPFNKLVQASRLV